MSFKYIPKIVYNSTTIEFPYPPEKDTKGQTIRASVKITTTKNGNLQVVHDYNEETFVIRFSFISEAIKTALETFLLTHAFYGEEFEYWFDKDEVSTKIIFQLDPVSYKAAFKIITRKGEGFIYKLKLTLRRVV